MDDRTVREGKEHGSIIIGLCVLVVLLVVIVVVQLRGKGNDSSGRNEMSKEVVKSEKASQYKGDLSSTSRKGTGQTGAEAMFNTGLRYMTGEGVPIDMEAAVKWWRKAADQGCASAQYNLGVCYADGKGVPKDEVTAVKWYRRAAELGHVDAQNNLGACYLGGHGVPRDKKGGGCEVVVQGVRTRICRCAIRTRSLLLQWHGGVGQDKREAVKWWRKAAEQGQVDAQYDLGHCYCNGEGVMQDMMVATTWWRKAAEQGYAKAQYNLGICYFSGQGVAQDKASAVKWWWEAAEQGNANAQCNLAASYYDGDGVKKDGPSRFCEKEYGRLKTVNETGTHCNLIG